MVGTSLRSDIGSSLNQENGCASTPHSAADRSHVAILLLKLGAENLTSSIGKPRPDAAASTSPATRVGVVGFEVCEGGHRGGGPIHPSFAELALSGVGGHGDLASRTSSTRPDA